ncbi:MAG: SixA phosphatase family protein [Sphingomonas sp.]
MKRLTLLRHAKSGWDDPVQRDYDRPLNAKGHRGAALMGQYLARERLRFDHVIASPAVRVAETLAELARGYGEGTTTHWEKRIYLASAVTLLDVVHGLPDTAQSVLMVGHNPGLEDLVLTLVPDKSDDALRARVEEKFPTASIAELALEVAHWAAVAPQAARLTRFVRPRDLDPTLGPDAD